MESRWSMEARTYRLVLLTTSLLSLGASHRTTNFVVSAPTREFARTVGEVAEKCRHDLAVEWLGHVLPRWPQPCPISVQAAPHLGAGGATSFAFHNGQPVGWTMSIQGSQERIIDSVLPHEITHTIFATHFGRPLPRWADEGACTTVEHVSERQKQHGFLLEFLTTGRGIAFNRMFAMKEYPSDILPLYSQGYSLARFFIAQGGRRTFVQYVGDGMRTNDWGEATRRYYGFRDLSDLQVSWLQWVKHGSRNSEARELLAARMGREDFPSEQRPEPVVRAQNDPQRGLFSLTRLGQSAPGQSTRLTPASLARETSSSRSAALDRLPERASASGSWYANQKNRARPSADRDPSAADRTSRAYVSSAASAAGMDSSTSRLR